MLDYVKLLKFAVAILLAVIVLRWVKDAPAGTFNLLPSRRHTSYYNFASIAMVGIGAWGLARILKHKKKG